MINLLPTENKDDIDYGRKNTQITRWLVTVLFGMTILLLITLVGKLTIQTAQKQVQSEKETIEAQLSEAGYDKINDQYADYVDGLSSVRKLYQQQVLYSRLLRKIGTLLPPGARLTNISIGEKDKALTLNFDNDVDGLGSTIQLNLTDQSKQVVDITRSVFNGPLELPINTTYDIRTDKEEKSISFRIDIKDIQTEKAFNRAIKNGGEMAFALTQSTLSQSPENFLADYRAVALADTDGDGILSTIEKRNIESIKNTLVATPQIRSYTVNSTEKYVDFVVRANSIADAKRIEPVLLKSDNTLFSESYSFEDDTYMTRQKCVDQFSDAQTCSDIDAKDCVPISSNGCQYIVRAYYDELYKNIGAKKVSDQEKSECQKSGTTCTHLVEATYSQLFSKVDINRVASCISDSTTQTSVCPVELRAEFSTDAKFYLMSQGSSN